MAAKNTVGENSSVGEKEAEKPPLAKNPNRLKAKASEFSPTHFSPTLKPDFSPTAKGEFSPTKKAKLKLVTAAKNGKRGRPRNPNLPPAPGEYYYWTKARNGLKLERRDEYEYIGFIMPNEWRHLRGKYDEEYILKIITAAIRVKRARSAQTTRISGGIA